MISLSKVAALLSVATLMFPAPALADWVLVSMSDNGTGTFVETDSVTRSGRYVSFLERKFLSVPQDDGTAIPIGDYTINCTSGERYLHRLAGFTESGQVVFDYKYTNPKPRPGIPGSVGGNVHELVCY
jgi:hypothetical protein